jgi:hypothetical protein
MFSISNKKNDAANVVREKAIEPKKTRPRTLCIDVLENRLAPHSWFDVIG